MEEAHSFIKPTIKKGDLILITGATGYIGSNVADQALEAGYRVRGTTRSRAKGQWLYDLLLKKYGEGKFELVEVPDMLVSSHRSRKSSRLLIDIAPGPILQLTTMR